MFLLPLAAQANFVTFISDLFFEETEASVIKGPNLQKIDLLRAPISPFSSIGGADISIAYGDSLVAESGPAGSSADIVKENGQISIYIVREGDSISQIAEMFNVSSNTIRWGNDIKGNTITPGQSLVILPVTGIKHTVEKGDNLDSIVKKYDGSKEEIIAYNNLNSNQSLTVGDEIIIPNGVLPSTSSSDSSGNTKSSAPRTKTSSSVAVSGYFIKPIRGGYRSQGIHGYNGVDLAAPMGTAIVAAASGEITVSRGSGWNGGYGSYIVISHSNGTQTLYAHNSQNIVSVGEWVKQGQVIGYVGSTGRSTGPHVHFEVRGARNPF